MNRAAEERLALRGALPRALFGVTEGAEPLRAVELALVGEELLLAAKLPGLEPMPLREREDVRYEPGQLEDTLCLGPHRLAVPAGRGVRARRLIALGRLASVGPRQAAPAPARAVLLEEPLAVAFLSRFLAEGEELLGWVPVTPSLNVEAVWLARSTPAPTWLLLTEQRCALVALGELGDVRVEALGALRRLGGATAPHFEPLGRADLRFSAVQRAHHTLLEELTTQSERSAPERLLRAAEASFVHRAGARQPIDRALALLERATRLGSVEAPFCGRLIALELGETPLPTFGLHGLMPLPPALPERALAELWSRLGVSERSGRALLSTLRDHGGAAEPWAARLHQRLHDASPARPDAALDGEADLQLAFQLIDAGLTTDAAELLERRLTQLPAVVLEELLPPGDVDLTSLDHERPLRVRAVEQLARARRGRPEELAAISELARLEPLVLSRLRELAARAATPLAERTERALRALEPNGLTPHAVAPFERRERRPLPAPLVERQLQHPLTRADSPVVERLQTLLAAVPMPDLGFLTDYCEQLVAERHPEAAEALEECSRVLGTGPITGYVSRGKKSVGVRSYAAESPFVLLGGRHLEPGKWALGPRELRAALGAELAHVRLGHHRVTSADVWAGALAKGKVGLDLVLGFLPALKGIAAADQLARAVARVPLGPVNQVMRLSRLLRRRTAPGNTPESSISTLNEELIVAHRVVQLSADRAALLLSGDIAAALRAMVLVRKDYADSFEHILSLGLARVLGERAEDGVMAYQDLAIRVAAMVSFYLSPEWDRLQTAIQ